MKQAKDLTREELIEALRACSTLGGTCESCSLRVDSAEDSFGDCSPIDLLIHAADILETALPSDGLTEAGRAMVKYLPGYLNRIAADYKSALDDAIMRGYKPMDENDAAPVLTLSFDAELSPSALEALLGPPMTLRTIDEIGFVDPVTGETVMFRKEA